MENTVNFSTSKSPGTHFSAIIFDENEISIYFAPLDLIFIPLEIQNYMNENSKKTHVIRHSIRHPLSGYRGFYCLPVILFHVNNIPFDQWLGSF